jgi:hypothetical protein
MSEPVLGVAYDTPIQLTATATGEFLVDPTIEAGDVTVIKDYVSLGNIDTLPAASPAGTSSVRVDLSAAEMGAKDIVNFKDQTEPPEWEEISIILDVPRGTTDTINDILEGDHKETSTSVIIKKKGTSEIVLQKDVTGSFLVEGATIATTEP